MFRLELLSGVECQRCLVSTNAAVYGHPDRQTAELVARSSRDFPEFLCNYESATTLRADRRGRYCPVPRAQQRTGASRRAPQTPRLDPPGVCG